LPGRDQIGVRDFYRGKVVLMTGCTGYVGKIMLEKLMRSVPDVGRVYVLIRVRQGKTLD